MREKGEQYQYTYKFRFLANGSAISQDRQKGITVFCNKINYDKSYQFDTVKEVLVNLFSDVCCKYYNQRNCVIPAEMSKYILKDNVLVIDYIDQNIIETIAAQFAILGIFFKNPCFYPEEEYRIAIVLLTWHFPNVNEIINFRIYNGVFIPYIEISFKIRDDSKIPCIPIKCITVGPKNNLDIAVFGLKQMLLYFDYNDIDIKVSKIPLRY